MLNEYQRPKHILEYSCPSLIHVRMVGLKEMFPNVTEENKIYSRATTEHKKKGGKKTKVKKKPQFGLFSLNNVTGRN